MECVALDLETTGLDPERDRLIEFCFVRLDGAFQEIDRWAEVVDPGVPIPEEATAIHGIRDGDVRGRPPFADFAARVQELLSDKILIAYNHPLDRDVLHYELRRAGQPGIHVEHPFIDPFQIFRRHRPHSLEGAVRQYLGRGFDGSHRAEADTDAMIEVLRAQVEIHHLPTHPEKLVEKPERQWLDRARRVYRDEDGTVRFGFGKYRNDALLDHEDYARWMMSADFPMDTKRTLGAILDAARAGGSPPAPSPPHPREQRTLVRSRPSDRGDDGAGQ